MPNEIIAVQEKLHNKKTRMGGSEMEREIEMDRCEE